MSQVESRGMDGLARSFPLAIEPQMQRTLKAPIDCVGAGLHCGKRIRLVLLPAPVGTGIVFRRTDLPSPRDIPARYDHVVETRLSTVLALPGAPEHRVGTVEHVMAAFAGLGIANAIVEVDGPEVPILDGSADGLVFLMDCAGIAEQSAFVACIEVLRPVRVTQGDSFAELRPSRFGLDLSMSIAFDAPAIGHQALTLRLTPDAFRSELARARTFTLAGEVEQMRAAGLALGGSLDNAVVVDGARILNPAGLRMSDEFVRHKMLDAVGDLALAGGRVLGRLVGHRSGHTVNNRLLRALFADACNWRLAPAPEMAGFASTSLPLNRRAADKVAAAA
jgi:UDP-3-O-[3-hydroxymyristoyl] N-acetylglucosamine deacetylase